MTPAMLLVELLTYAGDTNNSPEQQQLDEQRKQNPYKSNTPARTGPGGLLNLLLGK